MDTRRSQKRTHGQFRAGFFASAGAEGLPLGAYLLGSASDSELHSLPPPFTLTEDQAGFHLHISYSLALPPSPPLSRSLSPLPRAPMPARHYSKFIPPSLAMSELVCQKLDNDATDMLIDKWLERPHRPDSYHDWFQRVRERKHLANTNAHIARRDQVLLWNKGVFVPENIFTRTVDTGRLIPLDRTWVTHVYHHRSMKRLTMMPVIFSMVRPLVLRLVVRAGWPPTNASLCFSPCGSFQNLCSSAACTTAAATTFMSL